MAADRPPERIVVDDVGVVLRRHRADDVDALHGVIEESRDHLRSFMPWADQAREETAEFLTRSVAEWEAGTSFNYLVTLTGHESDAEEILGGTGLHERGAERSLEIGYWLRSSATGRGVVTAAARRLTNVAIELGVEQVVICCDEANDRSAAVPQRLGFRLDRIEPRPITAPGEHGRHMVWVFRAADQTPDLS
jgi:RimJ/RimL family protein N-acetyltransferase